jgi:hypothetical protein
VRHGKHTTNDDIVVVRCCCLWYYTTVSLSSQPTPLTINERRLAIRGNQTTATPHLQIDVTRGRRSSTSTVPSGRAASSDGDDVPNVVTVRAATNDTQRNKHDTPNHDHSTPDHAPPQRFFEVPRRQRRRGNQTTNDVLSSFVIIRARVSQNPLPPLIFFIKIPGATSL